MPRPPVWFGGERGQLPGEQALADRRQVQGQQAPLLQHHPQRLGGLEGVEHKGRVVSRHCPMGTFTREPDQFLQERRGQLAEPLLRRGEAVPSPCRPSGVA